MPTTVAQGAIRVEGLKELQAALRDADRGFARQLRVANNDAAQLVVTRGRLLAGARGKMFEKAAETLRATSEQRNAKVTLGSARVPWACGANFGARHDVERTTPTRQMLGWNQFPEAVKGHDVFLYAAVEETTPEPFMHSYEDAIDKLLRDIERLHPFKARGISGSTIGA